MSFRKGDKVSITGIIKHAPEGKEKVFVQLPDYHSDVWVSQSAVKLVQAAFEVGDRVWWEDLEHHGEIIGISGEHAWIEWGNGEYCTRHLGAIQRLDEPEETDVV